LTRTNSRSVFASRLGFAFALVAAMTAILAGVITYIAWSFAFEGYVRRNLEDKAAYVASQAAEAYALFDGWDFSPATAIPQVAVRQDISVQIFDSDGHLLYDEKLFALHPHDSAGPASADQNYADQNYSSQGVNQGLQILRAGDRDVVTAAVMVDQDGESVQVGEVRVYAFGSAGLLTNHDLEMRATSLLALSVSGFVAIIVSTVVGLSYSRRLVMPIQKVTDAARRMRDGDENARANLVGDDEIAQLGITFDNMADAISRRRERERNMTGDVAHELRTPLMSIQATLEAIQDGIYPADTEHLQIISRETKRLTGLTNAMLDLTLLESHKEAFPLSHIDLNEPVNASLAINLARIESMHLHIQTNLAEGLLVNGNVSRLQQAITNLLANAARYTPAGGTISVRTFKRGNAAYLSVSDTGVGIDQDSLEHIFKRFWRADDARGRATGGVGVGLTIAKEIVDRHQGELTIESEKGEGTTCTISVPLVNQ